MLSPAYFTDAPIRMGHPPDDAFMRRNYDLCKAVDLLKLGIVLDELVKAGMPKEQQALFYANAEALLQLMRTENNRLRDPAPTPGSADLCEDCPPVGYLTDKTRCLPCPRRGAPDPAEGGERG